MPRRVCRSCGQVIPPKLKLKMETPKLRDSVVKEIHESRLKRGYLAQRYFVPLRMVTAIKRLPLEEALAAYGH